MSDQGSEPLRPTVHWLEDDLSVGFIRFPNGAIEPATRCTGCGATVGLEIQLSNVKDANFGQNFTVCQACHSLVTSPPGIFSVTSHIVSYVSDRPEKRITELRFLVGVIDQVETGDLDADAAWEEVKRSQTLMPGIDRDGPPPGREGLIDWKDQLNSALKVIIGLGIAAAVGLASGQMSTSTERGPIIERPVAEPTVDPSEPAELSGEPESRNSKAAEPETGLEECE